jgi:hypothetical protein
MEAASTLKPWPNQHSLLPCRFLAKELSARANHQPVFSHANTNQNILDAKPDA